MIVRIVSAGWETFTGSMGHLAVFKDGLSVGPLNARQIARIGSSVKIVNEETGEQLGPAASMVSLQRQDMVVPAPVINQVDEKAAQAVTAERLAVEQKEREAVDAAALKAAKEKAETEVDKVVIYSRKELEAIGGSDGIAGLRAIATPLGVKGRGIGEMVNEVLAAQAKLTVV